MSDICTVKKSTLDGIAEAIQSKTGESGGMLPSEMAGKIEALPSQPAKGLVFSDYDSDGYPHKAEFVGTWAVIPQNYLYYYQNKGVSSFMGKVTRLVIPNGVTSIAMGAFQSCSQLKEIIMPHNNLTVASLGFHSCSSVTSYHFFENLTITGSQAFDGATNLTQLIVDGNLSQITNQCFRYASKLELLDLSHCTAIPTLYSTASLGHANGCVIKVPSALLTDWQNATNWSALTNVTWQGV